MQAATLHYVELRAGLDRAQMTEVNASARMANARQAFIPDPNAGQAESEQLRPGDQRVEGGCGRKRPERQGARGDRPAEASPTMTRLRRDSKPRPAAAPTVMPVSSEDARIDAIRRLLRDICEAADGRDLAPPWGTTDGPASPGARFEVACPPDLPFAALGVIPWPDETYGLVDVRLRDGPWKRPPIESAFGPFREDIQIPGVPGQMVAHLGRPRTPGDSTTERMGQGRAPRLDLHPPRPATAVLIAGTA